MEMKQWVLEARSVLEELKNLKSSYLFGTNEVLDPQKDFALLDQLVVEYYLPNSIQDFYRECGGVWLSDVCNGYWVYSFENVFNRIQAKEITNVKGIGQGEIVIFGGNGGGGRFALRTHGKGEIIYLPSSGKVQSSTWFSETEKVHPIVLADDFSAFLDVLLNDIKSFVYDTPNWSYMPSQ